MEVVEGLNMVLLPVNIFNGDGRVELMGVVLYCIRAIIPWFSIFH